MLRMVQTLMRHANIATTANYCGVEDDERAAAISAASLAKRRTAPGNRGGSYSHVGLSSFLKGAAGRVRSCLLRLFQPVLLLRLALLILVIKVRSLEVHAADAAATTPLSSTSSLVQWCTRPSRTQAKAAL